MPPYGKGFYGLLYFYTHQNDCYNNSEIVGVAPNLFMFYSNRLSVPNPQATSKTITFW